MKTFIDIGELGWALYLSAHINWLNERVAVFTDREELYEGCRILDIPKDFNDLFGKYPPDCSGRHGISHSDIVSFFKDYLPKGYELGEAKYCCDRWFEGKVKFKPYPYKREYPKNILVFPRKREHSFFTKRNLPKQFYIDLLHDLCSKFTLDIVTIGTKNGAYNIDLNYGNYRNLVITPPLQTLIDLCHTSIAAVGGTSAPPKISLLQGVPTYIIGHEKKRFTEDENWLKTKVGFWEIGPEDYNNFNNKNCIKDIMKFL